MKFRCVLLLMLATALLFSCSCKSQPISQNDSTSDEMAESALEPQYMAYRLGEISRVGDDIYFVSSTSFSDAQIFATEYGSENFDIFVPCFDAVCNHSDRSNCCITTSLLSHGTDSLTAILYNEEPALVLFNPIDISFSMPYSNVKVALLAEDFVENNLYDYVNSFKAYKEWNSSESRIKRSEPLVYKDYLYYVELKSGVRTQYRISISGGKPERVFEEDNIIIKTIINDKFYGIRYDVDLNNPEEFITDREKIHYFRSDMNYENAEPLPEILDFFVLQGEAVGFNLKSNAILDADADFIYVTEGMKVWAVPNSDINAEPIMLSDMKGTIPYEQRAGLWQTSWYSDGIIYTILNDSLYNRDLLDSQGKPTSPTKWYESSKLYSFDIRTGECRVLDISNSNYLLTEILYADGKYVYAKGRYAHNDNRGIQGVTIRLTLDTMRYEVILPDRFLEYSAETTAS